MFNNFEGKKDLVVVLLIYVTIHINLSIIENDFNIDTINLLCFNNYISEEELTSNNEILGEDLTISIPADGNMNNGIAVSDDLGGKTLVVSKYDNNSTQFNLSLQ